MQEAVLLLRCCRQAGAKSPGRTARSSAPRHSAHCVGTWLSDSGTKPAREPLDMITRTVTAVICYSAQTGGGAQIKIQMQFVTSVHQRSERRPPTHNTHNYIQVKPDTFRSSLGALAKLRKATVGFVISVRPSVCPHGTTRLLLDGLSRNLIFEYFSKNCRENQVSLKSDQNGGYFT